MASGNKTLGLFKLDGIPAAPRGVPQIEVTFDIDANGIVNVSAKDMGTGKEQKVTITSSTNMSKEDIEKAVAEAEKFAAEDKAKKEEIDLKNSADQMIYQSEKTLNEVGDKVSDAEKETLKQKIQALKDAVASNKSEDIKAKQEDLQKSLFEMSTKLYQQANPQADANAAGTEGAANDNVVDADYKDVTDENNQ